MTFYLKLIKMKPYLKPWPRCGLILVVLLIQIIMMLRTYNKHYLVQLHQLQPALALTLVNHKALVQRRHFLADRVMLPEEGGAPQLLNELQQVLDRLELRAEHMWGVRRAWRRGA